MRKTANRLADSAASAGYMHGWDDAHAACKVRIAELEAALRLIEKKSQGAVDYLKDSGEMLFLQYAQGCLDTACKALSKE